MAYKVEFQTLAVMDDGRIGNIVQSREIIYTDCPIDHIPSAINKDLEERKRVCEILKIETLKGKCLFISLT